MAVLQVRDMDDRLYEILKNKARIKHRSISQEVVRMLEKQLAQPDTSRLDQTEAFLDLCGAWQDDRSAEEIIDDIRSSRIASQRFEDSNGLFD